MKSATILAHAHVLAKMNNRYKGSVRIMKLYVKDMASNVIHEIGSDRHDSLMLIDGGLFYYNLHNGEGTYGGGYKFCDKNGNTDYDNEEQDNFYHIGFSEEKFRKQYEKEMELLKKVLENDK